MNLVETSLKDVFIIEPRIFNDDRGYFFESYNEKKFLESGLSYNFVQDNESMSTYGVVRGLHYQLDPNAQTKLVRVIQGKVWDVAVDLRKNSPSYLQWFGVELSAENKRQMLIPAGFAHGFSVLSEKVIFSYKCDKLYCKEAEGGIIFNDPTLNIDWRLPDKDMILSEKDLVHPVVEEANYNFKL